MQTLQQEIDPTPQRLRGNDHPVFREMMADPAVAYAEEVRSLRQRVSLLEAELAATKASTVPPTRQAPPLTSIDFAPKPKPEPVVSEFTASVTPAVMAVQPAASAAVVDRTPASTPAAEPTPEPGFAQAWTADAEATSFEERVAEKAFFQASTVDEESRSWLLEQ